MRQIKTIIADDDYLVRSYLKILPAWKENGFEITGEARDGEEAYRILMETDAELLITDVSMPFMNGIELIKKVRKENKHIYIIVLSCHDDFEYVKDAMKEGANEYILKNTLDQDSLSQLLVNTRNSMEEQEKKEIFSDNTGDSMNRKGLFFNSVLSGAVKGEEKEAAAKAAGVTGSFHNCAVVCMYLESSEAEEERWTHFEAEQQCQIFYQRLCRELEEHFKNESYRTEVVYLGTGIFCCFLDLSDIRKSSVMQQKLTDTAVACYKICKKEEHCYRICVSNVCIGAEALVQAYQQARDMMHVSFYDRREILYYQPDCHVNPDLPDGLEECRNRIHKAFAEKDKDSFVEEGRKVWDLFRDRKTESRLVIQWFRRLEQEMGIDIQRDYRKVTSLRQLESWYQKDEEYLFCKKKTQIPENINKTVRIAAEFIQNHFKEPIGLTEAAQEAGVNPSYLSYLFTQEMGIGFSNFLLSQRLSCAGELLEQTDLKIREIGNRSGFNDYHYFSKAFKKRYGMSPAEYRRHHTRHQ